MENKKDEKEKLQKFVREIKGVLSDGLKAGKIGEIDEENIERFFFALSIAVPCVFYNKMLEKNASVLEDNHISKMVERIEGWIDSVLCCTENE